MIRFYFSVAIFKSLWPNYLSSTNKAYNRYFRNDAHHFSINENNNPNLPQDNGEHILVQIGIESAEDYIERNSGATPLGRYGFCFFSSVKNTNQLNLVWHHFAQMHRDDRGNSHLPTDYDNPSDMPPLDCPGATGCHLSCTWGMYVRGSGTKTRSNKDRCYKKSRLLW